MRLITLMGQNKSFATSEYTRCYFCLFFGRLSFWFHCINTGNCYIYEGRASFFFIIAINTIQMGSKISA